MSTPNFYGREACSSEMFLSVKDSETGFLNFLSEYKLLCDDNWTNEKILVEAKRRWSEMSRDQREPFKDVCSSCGCVNQSSSQKSVASNCEQAVECCDQATSVMSETSYGCGDAGFDQFLEEYTMQASEAAARYWDKMSKRQRAEYAYRDGCDYSSSVASFATEGVDDPTSAMSGDYTFDRAGCARKKRMSCAKPKRKSCHKPMKRRCASKPRCPKPRCPKPRAARKCHKPRAAKRCPKPRCPKRCPKPRSAKRCPKPNPACPMMTFMKPEEQKTKDQEPNK